MSPRTWSAAPPASRASRPLSARSVLHLLTLSTLAVAHPLYALLRVEEHAPFLAAHHAQAVDLWLLATVVSIGFPAVLLATLGLVQLVSRRLARWVYGFLLFTLFAVLFAPIPERLLGEMGRTAPAIALGAAAATTWLYFAGSAVRSFVTFISVAVVASPLYFASGASVRPILWPAEALDHATILSGAHLPDVVMIVLDELPVTSILDAGQGIDAIRFPNLARLALTSTWYRRTSTVHWSTMQAVPAILTGRRDRFARKHDLFALLEKTHHVLAIEHVTEFSRTSEEVARRLPPLADRVGLLLADTSLLYAHIVAPGVLRARLPEIGTQWVGFLTQDDAASAPVEEDWPYQGHFGKRVKMFLDLIEPREVPAFYFLHIVLPHEPYQFNPWGQRHDRRKLELVARKVTPENPGASESEVLLAYQAHLLQASYADRLLGEILDRLEMLGLFDDALVVVTADHGISFFWNHELGDEEFQRIQADDIMYVPLLIKTPGQDSPSVSDALVEIVDIVPTLADLLEFEIPWEVDGLSVLAEPVPDRKRIALLPDRVEFGRVIDPEQRSLARKFELFGSGDLDRVYAFGPYRELVGERVDTYAAVSSDLELLLENEHRYRSVDPDGPFVPVYINGRIEGDTDLPAEPVMAIAINGVIRATTTATRHDTGLRFVTRVPPKSFTRGSNRVTAHALVLGESGQVASLIDFVPR